jgi:hypothetical protein
MLSNAILESSINRSDVQRCVSLITLLVVFHPYVFTAIDVAHRENASSATTLPSTCVVDSLNDHFKHWYWTYIDHLQCHQLYSHGNEIIQLCIDTDFRKMN